MHRSILIGNTATPLSEAERVVSPPDHTHRWTVAVRSAASHPLPTISEAEQLGLSLAVQQQQQAGGEAGTSVTGAASMNTRGREHETDYHKMVGGKDDISHFIKRVQFKLHETYPQHTRNIDKPPFQVTETGWGEFDVQIRIFFVAEAGEKPISTFHRLKLHPWHPIAIPAQLSDVTAEAGDGSAARDATLGQTTADETALFDQTTSMAPDSTMDNEDEAQADEGEGVETDLSMAAVDEGDQQASRQSQPPHPSVAMIKAEDVSTPSIVHETRSASAAAAPAAPARPLPAVVHSWSYDELVFPEPTEAFYEILISNPPTPLPAQSAQAFSDPVAYEQYKSAALAHLDPSGGPSGRDLHTELGIVPPHPLHDASGALFDALSQESVLAEGERLDKARHNAVRELEETRAKLIDGERNLRQARPAVRTTTAA